jgi:hypothetical protein
MTYMPDSTPSTLEQPARMHLIPALSAPRVIVIRRKPSRVAHVMCWNTETDEIEHGSWFRGRIYELRCDVSPDGERMAYLAAGVNRRTWTGVCSPPWLKTAVDQDNAGTQLCGGVFRSDTEFDAEKRAKTEAVEPAGDLPQQPLTGAGPKSSGDEAVLFPRLKRDGWRQLGYGLLGSGGQRWESQPTPAHPVLTMWDKGWQENQGHVLEFEMAAIAGLVGPDVSWAAWDCLGQLVLARRGVLERYTLDGLERGEPAFVLDLEGLQAGNAVFEGAQGNVDPPWLRK